MKNFIRIILFPVLLLILTGCAKAPSDTAVSDASAAKTTSSDASLADDTNASTGEVKKENSQENVHMGVSYEGGFPTDVFEYKVWGKGKKASWGYVEFVAVESDNDLVYPLIIQIARDGNKAIEGELKINTAISNDTKGPSEYHGKFAMQEGEGILVVEFPITASEKNKEIVVSALVNNELSFANRLPLIKMSKSEVKKLYGDILP